VTRPWLSVIVPTFNGADYLRQAFESIASENDPNLELLVVDDGSSDGTGLIVDEFVRRMNAKAWRRPVGNWVANTNYALERASGEWVSFLHQDDFWLPGRLSALRRQLAETPDVALVLHACTFVDPDGRELGPWRCPLSPGRTIDPSRTLEHLLVQNFIGIAGALFRRQTALASAGMDDSLWYTADWDLWLKLAAAGDTVYLPRSLASFRVHSHSQTARRSRSPEDFRAQLLVTLDRHERSWRCHRRVTRAAVRRTAQAAVEINVALAAAYHRQPVNWRPFFAAVAHLRPWDWPRLLRDSRLIERVGARMRAGFLSPPGARRCP
jgi:glycosyltransferase involved in cell wall biosynthesis